MVIVWLCSLQEARRKGADFTVRVKTGEHRLVAEDITHRLDFLIDPTSSSTRLPITSLRPTGRLVRLACG